LKRTGQWLDGHAAVPPPVTKQSEKAHKIVIAALVMDVAFRVAVECGADAQISGRRGQNALIQIKGFRVIRGAIQQSKASVLQIRRAYH
jgi:hypothetical protein